MMVSTMPDRPRYAVYYAPPGGTPSARRFRSRAAGGGAGGAAYVEALDPFYEYTD